MAYFLGSFRRSAIYGAEVAPYSNDVIWFYVRSLEMPKNRFKVVMSSFFFAYTYHSISAI